MNVTKLSLAPTGVHIEKGIPLPAMPFSHKLYPLDAMDVGDSFLCSTDKVRSAAAAYGKRSGKTFSCRVVDGGVRAWRTA